MNTTIKDSNFTGRTPSLEEFIWIWNHSQNMSFPHHHKAMAAWLEKVFSSDDKKALLLAFRNSGKSTLIGLFCAYILTIKSGIRILIVAADFELAKKMVRNIKRIIERHPLTEHLRPKVKDQWASDRFTVARESELRDPSVLAKGLGANITGSRADIIICDDVEVPKTCSTEAKRRDLRAKLSELDFVLTPGGMILYIGTPHTFYTIYQTTPTAENPAFLEGYKTLRIPIEDKNGNSAWKERFPKDKIESLKLRSGPNKFMSQMMLRPINFTKGRLDVDRLQIYDDELFYKESNRTSSLFIGTKKMLSVSAWWDPAWGKKQGLDSSVIACVFTGADGLYHLHKVKYLDTSDDDNQATRQALEVIAFIKENYLPAIHVESNGIGKFLPSILRQELINQGVRCGVIESISHKNKAERIIEAFDAPLANRALLVHKSVYDTPFIAEMRDWTPLGSGHDDGLDAVAGCLLSEPIRMTNTIPTTSLKMQNWQGGGSFIAASDFTF